MLVSLYQALITGTFISTVKLGILTSKGICSVLEPAPGQSLVLGCYLISHMCRTDDKE